jgi:hypothetical protein
MTMLEAILAALGRTLALVAPPTPTPETEQTRDHEQAGTGLGDHRDPEATVLTTELWLDTTDANSRRGKAAIQFVKRTTSYQAEMPEWVFCSEPEHVEGKKREERVGGGGPIDEHNFERPGGASGAARRKLGCDRSSCTARGTPTRAALSRPARAFAGSPSNSGTRTPSSRYARTRT